MPMLQEPLRVPAAGVDSSMSVRPEMGKFLLIPKLGILIAEEQSKVPLVLNLKIVGMPALAVLVLGEYPPLAFISIIWTPSFIVTLFAEVILPPSVLGLPLVKMKTPPIRTSAMRMAVIVPFIN